MNVQPAVADFLDHCRSRKALSPNTLRAYQMDLADFVTFVSPHTAIADIGTQTIKHFLDHLLSERALKPATVKRRLACLKLFFLWLEDLGEISRTPLYRFDDPVRLPATAPDRLTRAELLKLVAYCRTRLDLPARDPLAPRHLDCLRAHPNFVDFTAYLALELLSATGMRVSELINVTPADLDAEACTVAIRGKGHRERTVPLPRDPLVDVLLPAYLARTERLGHPATPILINTRGAPASAHFIRKLLHQAGRGAGFARPVTPLTIRHTTGALLLEDGVDIRIVQRLLGHGAITTTENYSTLSSDDIRSAMAKCYALNEERAA